MHGKKTFYNRSKLETNKDDTTDFNILLLGVTGIGKSTFINSIANYLQNHVIDEAKKSDLTVLIPGEISVWDKFSKEHRVKIGSQSDKNEYLETGASATQNVKTYVFPIKDGKTRLRFIDTPGMGDTGGLQRDNENCECIINYLSNLKELHAICYLLKPDESRVTAFVEYCVKQILTRLEKSASRNLVFIFTHSKATNYKPAETIPCLRRIIEDVKKKPPFAEIPLGKNIFSFDNESFRYLAALKRGIQFDPRDVQSAAESWRHSAKESWRLIAYIIGDETDKPLPPHRIENTVSVVEARRMVTYLSRPMAEICELLADNIRILKRRRDELQYTSHDITELKKKLYVPSIGIKVIELQEPVTVCCSDECCETISVEDIKKRHYKQKCHNPCYLRGIDKEIIGHPGLAKCAAMNPSTKTCKECSCAFSSHMHVYFLTETFKGNKFDKNIAKHISTREEALNAAKNIEEKVRERIEELENEKNLIMKCTALFAHFLKNNALTPINDAYKTYIEYLIKREEGLGSDCDMGTINQLNELIAQHELYKKSFEDALNLEEGYHANEINSKLIRTRVEELFKLKNFGNKIKLMYNIQKKIRNQELQNIEYVHAAPVSQPSDDFDSDSDAKSQSDQKKQFNRQGKKWIPKEQFKAKNRPNAHVSGNKKINQKEPLPNYKSLFPEQPQKGKEQTKAFYQNTGAGRGKFNNKPKDNQPQVNIIHNHNYNPSNVGPKQPFNFKNQKRNPSNIQHGYQQSRNVPHGNFPRGNNFDMHQPSHSSGPSNWNSNLSTNFPNDYQTPNSHDNFSQRPMMPPEGNYQAPHQLPNQYPNPPPNYSSNQPPNYIPNQPPNYSPNQPPNYSPNQPPNYPNQPPNYPQNQPLNHPLNQPPNQFPNQPPNHNYYRNQGPHGHFDQQSVHGQTSYQQLAPPAYQQNPPPDSWLNQQHNDHRNCPSSCSHMPQQRGCSGGSCQNVCSHNTPQQHGSCDQDCRSHQNVAQRSCADSDSVSSFEVKSEDNEANPNSGKKDTPKNKGTHFKKEKATCSQS